MAMSPLPRLLVPLEQAAEKIKEQINKGRQIHSRAWTSSTDAGL
jgi:hypothetical protein